MARLGLEMGAVLTSPLVRARQTAQIVAEALELTERTIVAEELDGRFCLAGLRRLVAGYGDVRGLGLVGHEPTFSMTIADLIGGGEIEVKKGSLAVVEADRIEPGAALLRMLLPPSVLREIGAAR
jgi:phosphohistidine phosphatase